MNRYDSDITETDWSEFAPREKADRCPITGVATAPGQLPGGSPDEALMCQSAGSTSQSNSKLKAMFDKFLYQK